MKYYEKAIENYAKERKKFHERELKREIDWYNSRIAKMTVTGECHIIHCEICPLWLFPNYRDYRYCDKLTKEQVRALILKEVEE